ncbi:hypothetical protein J2S06_003183 [Bacillus alveayuensis]|uniref:DUF3953 domain-containing protein n=1 Tax=Aeribacillus alveayuensis TaxID=279215 RepID=A0ABT9VST5_9BACI|nr:hypothetical protein [Bacillus alveayuensis]
MTKTTKYSNIVALLLIAISGIFNTFGDNEIIKNVVTFTSLFLCVILLLVTRISRKN